MKYLLDEKEYRELVPDYKLIEADKALELAREMISNKTEEQCRRGYCDTCPLSDIGGKENEIRPTRAISRQICKLQRNYPK